jgi:hypothetical protein
LDVTICTWEVHETYSNIFETVCRTFLLPYNNLIVISLIGTPTGNAHKYTIVSKCVRKLTVEGLSTYG